MLKFKQGEQIHLELEIPVGNRKVLQNCVIPVGKNTV